jgi:chromosome segregation ATPase
MRQEIVLATRQLVSNQKKVALHKVTVEQLEEDREILKGKLSILEKDLELAQKKLEENKRKVEELDKNRGSINRTLQRAVAVTNEHISQSTTHELAVRNLQVNTIGF